jgi:hypothetical protein
MATALAKPAYSRRMTSRIETMGDVWVYWRCQGIDDVSRVCDLSPGGLFLSTPVKPRLDGMLVWRSDVRQVAALERANVRVHKLRGGCIRRRGRRLSPSAVFFREFPGSATGKQEYGSSKPV